MAHTVARPGKTFDLIFSSWGWADCLITGDLSGPKEILPILTSFSHFFSTSPLMFIALAGLLHATGGKTACSIVVVTVVVR